jgi:hypothetical protein
VKPCRQGNLRRQGISRKNSESQALLAEISFMEFIGGMMKNSVVIIAFIAFLMLIIGLAWYVGKKPAVIMKETVETNIHTVVKEILPSAEYASLVYNYQSVVSRKLNADSFLGLKASSVIFLIDGTIKLGFDCREIQAEEQGNQLILKMPTIKILSHEQYPEKAEIFDEKKGVFAHQNSLKDYFDLLGDNKKEQADKVLANASLFNQARDSAEQLFKPLLAMNPAIKDKYTIIFQW